MQIYISWEKGSRLKLIIYFFLHMHVGDLVTKRSTVFTVI